MVRNSNTAGASTRSTRSLETNLRRDEICHVFVRSTPFGKCKSFGAGCVGDADHQLDIVQPHPLQVPVIKPAMVHHLFQKCHELCRPVMVRTGQVDVLQVQHQLVMFPGLQHAPPGTADLHAMFGELWGKRNVKTLGEDLLMAKVGSLFRIFERVCS